MKLRLLAVFAMACLVAAGLAVASPAVKTLTAQSGAVQATLTWTPGKYDTAKNVHLRIARSGTTAFSKTLKGLSKPLKLQALDLDGNGEPEVIADFYTGGAHCCLYSLVYRYTGSTYTSLKHVWGDLDYRLKHLDDDLVLEWISADDRFAYAFTAYAASAFPIQIWDYRAGRMTDVTRRYPSWISNDAASLWKGYLQQRKTSYPDVRGILAPWVADEYLLGRQAQAWTTMRKLNRRRVLRGLGGDDPWAQGSAYLAKLKRFLTSHGYAR